MVRHKRTKKQLFKLITHYGIHIWAILIIANAVMIYTYQLTTHAASKTSSSQLHALDISQAPSPSTTISPSPSGSQPSTAPLGPSINLTFTVPGIGSGGGVMKPIHLKRNVTVFLFAPDVNSLNPTVKPLYTIQSFATFDADPNSPTYTSFINPIIDLGSDVKDGNYQIAFRTDLSLRTLIKQNAEDLGGEVIGLNKGNPTLPLPSQTVLMGDTIPDQGDNAIDVSDYNTFINCYGSRNTSSTFCKGKNYGDFNDDGVIDGVDYNILLRSLAVVQQEGLPIPKLLSPTPTPPNRISRIITPTVPIKKTKSTPTVGPATKTSRSGGAGAAVGGILFLFFIIILGVIAFLMYKKNDNIRTIINALIHFSPTGQPVTDTTEQPTEQTEATDQPADAPTKEAPTDKAPQSAETTSQQTEPSTVPTPSAAGEMVEKDYYVKKKGPDEAGTGMWLLLTDDNGPVQAHYSKNDAQDGFAKVKGVMKTENGKTFLEISELSAE